MRRALVPFIAAAAVLTTVAIVCFGELVRHPGDLLVGPQRNGWNDLTTYFVPLHRYPRECWDGFGQWPYWNPFRNAGVPHLGNPQAALFYPVNWLCWRFDAPHVLSWSLVFHHILGGLGTYTLCRRYMFGWLASLVGGSVFLAAPYLIAQTGEGHYAQICAVAWMPWIALAYESMRRGQWIGVVALATTLSLSFLAGHVQEWFYFSVILCAWVVIDAVLAWRSRGTSDRVSPHATHPSATFSAVPQPPRREGNGVEGEGNRTTASQVRLQHLLISGLLTTAFTVSLVVVDLVPILIYATQTARSVGLTTGEAGMISLNWCNLLQLLNPFALGGPDSYGGPDKFFWETLCSFGIAPLFLAVVAVFVRWRTFPVRRMSLTTLIVLSFGFGAGSPLFHCLFWLVPGLDRFRAPSRVLFFCSLGIAVLAAAGIDAIIDIGTGPSERGRRVFRRILFGLGAAFLAAMPITRGIDTLNRDVGAHSDPRHDVSEGDGIQRTDIQPAILRRAVERSIGSATNCAWLLGACLLAYAAVYKERLAKPAAWGLWLMCVAQLCLYAYKMLAVLPQGYFRAAGSERDLLAHSVPGRVLCPRTYLTDHDAQTGRILKLQGYEPVPLARYHQFMTALTGKPDATSIIFGDSSPELARLHESLLDLTNVRLVVQTERRSGDVPDEFHWQFVGHQSVASFHIGKETGEANEFVVFENSNALPRAFVVGQTRILDKSNPSDSVLQLRPREEALMTAEFLPPGPRAQFAPTQIVTDTPNRVVIEADLLAVGYLVLSDAWYPGWTALDNGKQTSVIPANVMFRAIPLSPGKHQIEFQYRPVGFRVLAIISLIAWLIAGILLAVQIVPSRWSKGRCGVISII